MSELLLPANYGREVTADYNEIREEDSESLKQAKLESWIAQRLGTVLMSKYPNRQWGVRVDLHGQVVTITCPSLSHEKGYVMKMRGHSIVALETRAWLAAGEILERYGISRSRKFNEDVLETLDRDAQDEVISNDG